MRQSRAEHNSQCSVLILRNGLEDVFNYPKLREMLTKLTEERRWSCQNHDAMCRRSVAEHFSRDRRINRPSSSFQHPVRRTRCNSYHMRFTSFSGFLRVFHTVSNTANLFARQTVANSLGRTPHSLPQRTVVYRSMPSFPFLGALFGTSSSMADNYPSKVTESEWQTKLTPGTYSLPDPYMAHR